MEWMPTAVLLLTALVAVAANGLLIVFGRGHGFARRAAGTLNLAMAASAFFAYSLFTSGSLIISPEYSVILGQGTLAWTWCQATILLIPFAIWMGLHSIRADQHRASWLGPMLVLGTMCGLGTVLRTRHLNPGIHSDFTIYQVDLWSFFLVAWVVLCIGDWFLTTLKIRDRIVRICGIAFVLSLAALSVNHRAGQGFVFADEWTLPLWQAAAWILIPLSLTLLTWIALRRSEGWIRRTVQIALSILAGIIGLITAGMVVISGISLSWPIVAYSTWIALLLISLFSRIRSVLREGILKEFIEGWRPSDIVTLAAIVALTVCLADLSHFTGMDPGLDLTILIIAWLVLLESATGYPLGRPVGVFLKRAPGRVAAMARHFNKKTPPAEPAVKNEPPAEPASKSGSLAKASMGVFLISIGVLVFLVVVNELLHAGKTIVEPFTTNVATGDNATTQKSTDDRQARRSADQPAGKGIDGQADVDHLLGTAVTQRAVNTLGLIRQEMRPELVLLSGQAVATPVPPPTQGAGGEHTAPLTAKMEEAGESQTMVEGNTLQLPGSSISIPLGFFLTPIQRPLRWILGTNVIRGHVQKDGANYAVLADSSSGPIWRVDLREDEAPPAETCWSDSQSAAKQKKSSKGGSDARVPVTQGQREIIDRLAVRLAYQIASSDPSLTRVGFTSVWRAIPDFREGLARWRSFESTRNYKALSQSIRCFRGAIEKDPQFALAYYRLGLALEQDGQPGLAVEALRNSIQANPRFVAGHLALAQALSYYELYFYNPPPALSYELYSNKPPHALSGYSQVSLQQPLPNSSSYSESGALLGHVLTELKEDASPTDKAEAYLGLCRNELYFRDIFYIENIESFAVDASGDVDVDKKILDWKQQYRQFFYCKRAEYLYSKLSSSLRADVRVRPNELWATKAIGFVLSHSPVDTQVSAKPPSSDEWRCGDTLPKSIFLKFAAKYYEKVKSLDPNDTEAACGFAMVMVSYDEQQNAALNGLKQLAAAHSARANVLFGQADRTFYNVISAPKAPTKDDRAILCKRYRDALEEYAAAIREEPQNAAVLNSYAYQVYLWHLRAARHPDVLPFPPAEDYASARDHAAQAERLTAEEGSRIEHRQIESTVGEVFLASGEPEKAIEPLKESLKPDAENPTGIEHPYFDEIRWDLAQAYMCASPRFQPDAEKQLRFILDEEKGREDQRFVGPPDDKFIQRNLNALSHNCKLFTSHTPDPHKPDQSCPAK